MPMTQTIIQPDRPLKGRIHDFHDELREFHDYCSFLCDSFKEIINMEEGISEETMRGAHFAASWTKVRLRELSTEICEISDLLE